MVSKKRVTPPLNTFIIRFWQESTGAAVCWYGQIQHIQTGEQRSFICEETMQTFIQRWVEMTKNDNQ